MRFHHCCSRLLPTILAAALLAVPHAASADRSNAIAGIDAWTSTVFQQGQSSFSGEGLRLRLDNTRLPQVQVMPVIEYWRNSSRVDEFGIQTARRDATLGTDARWNFTTKGAMHPYVGAGIGIHFLQSEVNAPSFGLDHAQDSVVRGGVALLAGANFGSERFGNFIEVKYHEIGSYRQVKLNFGLSWNFVTAPTGTPTPVPAGGH